MPWPKDVQAAGNAGLTVVGCSAQHGMEPAVLLGGRFYSSRKAYSFTDFGGGRDRKRGEGPLDAALREFAEELLGLSDERAAALAAAAGPAASRALVTGAPFAHRGYAMFVVPADSLVELLVEEGWLQPDERAACSIDALWSAARRNSELTSVALVALDEFMRGAGGDGSVRPLSVRDLDGASRPHDVVQLRPVMVGKEGSVRTIGKALRSFALQASLGAHELSTDATPAAPQSPPEVPVDGERAPPVARRARRWGQSEQADVQPGGSEARTSPAAVGARADGARRAAAEGRADATCTPSSSSRAPSQPYVFDMETGDPDDVLTLLLLCSHPAVELRAVTITPGSEEQVSLVRWILQQMGMEHVRIGAQSWPANAQKKVNLGASFYRGFGRAPRGLPACEPADRVLLECCDESATLVTGAPLHNLGDALALPGFRLGRWVAQGGFAGEGVVPREMQMSKFRGIRTCPTWNFGGNVNAAHAALSSDAILRKVCVSKNVCHDVVYDAEWHQALAAAVQAHSAADPQCRRASALGTIHESMGEYLRKKPGGKKLHDPLALAVALDESVCQLAEVSLFSEKGRWGSVLCRDSGTWISVAYDAAKFQSVLLR